FFFSSSRWHTRWPRDWSSDVCSSDLFPVNRADDVIVIGNTLARAQLIQFEVGLGDADAPVAVVGDPPLPRPLLHQRGQIAPERRSEERRVGKGSRSRWTAYWKQ